MYLPRYLIRYVPNLSPVITTWKLPMSVAQQVSVGEQQKPNQRRDIMAAAPIQVLMHLLGYRPEVVLLLHLLRYYVSSVHTS